jgi:hypothetical protein
VKKEIVNGFDYISMQQNTEQRMTEIQQWAAHERLARQARACTPQAAAGAERAGDRLRRWLASKLLPGAASNRPSRQDCGARASAETRAAQPVKKAHAEACPPAPVLQSLDGPLII